MINLARVAGCIRGRMGTGTLRRIRRTEGPRGLLPPKPVEIPIYLLQGLALLGGAIGLGLFGAALLKRTGRGNGHQHNGRH